jgi:hypothetical protein
MVAGGRIRATAPDDAGEIAAIYNHYIEDIKGTVYLSPSRILRADSKSARR